MSRRRFPEDVDADRLLQLLPESPGFAPVGQDEDEAQLWMNCELASFAENRFGERADPTNPVSDWTARVLAKDERLVDPRKDELRACMWIVDGGRRVGTLAVATYVYGRQYLDVSSLYVFPAERGRGFGYSALRAAFTIATAVGLHGIRLDTFWTWQDAVSRYVHRYGMWACSFKRAIGLMWDAAFPAHAIAFGDREARLSVEPDGNRVDLFTAERSDDRLVWHEHDNAAQLDTDIVFYARSTFAVALASRGWPLLTSIDELRRVRGYDVGGPAVLAHKIAVFEWVERRNGFAVHTRRIPGLPYEDVERELEEQA